MQILILGDNANAISVSKALANDHDIRLIGSNREALTHIENSVDCQVIHHDPLDRHSWDLAQIQDCDVLIAMTESEESNIIACQIITQLYPLQLVICTISNRFYPFRKQLFPSHSTTQYIVVSTTHLLATKLEQMLLHHHCEEVITTLNNRFCCLKIKLDANTPLLNQSPLNLNSQLPQGANIMALIRNDQCHSINNDTLFQPNDIILLAQPQSLSNSLTSRITAHNNNYKHVMIAGNGELTLALLAKIHHTYNITVIIEKQQHAQQVASAYPDVIVLHGKINDNDLLKDEDIGSFDVFIALSEDDENNLTSALQAENYGTKFIITLVNQPGLIPIIEHTPIHSIISPQNTLSDHIYQHTHPGAIQSIHHLDHQHGVLVEIILPKHLNNTKLEDWNLPKHACCVGLLSQDNIISTEAKKEYQTGDHFHVYLPNNTALERLQVLLANT